VQRPAYTVQHSACVDTHRVYTESHRVCSESHQGGTESHRARSKSHRVYGESHGAHTYFVQARTNLRPDSTRARTPECPRSRRPHFHEKAIICQVDIVRAPWRSSDVALLQFAVVSLVVAGLVAGPMNRAIHTSIRTLSGLRLRPVHYEVRSVRELGLLSPCRPVPEGTILCGIAVTRLRILDSRGRQCRPQCSFPLND
jgi:hypothetical protein